MKASNADLSLSCAPQKVVLVIFLFFFFFFPWRLCRLLNLGKSAVAFLIEKK